MIKPLGRIAIEPRRDSARTRGQAAIEACVTARALFRKWKTMPGQDAPAPHREQPQHDSQQRRVEELLEQAQEHVEEPEHQGREQDRRAGAVLVLQPGEDEAAERELLADGRDQGEDPDGDPDAGRSGTSSRPSDCLDRPTRSGTSARPDGRSSLTSGLSATTSATARSR